MEASAVLQMKSKSAEKRPIVVEGNPLSVADKTMNLIVSFGRPGNSKKLKESQFTALDADKKMIKANKILLDSKELKAIENADSNLKAYLDQYCLPHPNRAMKLIPLKKIVDIANICDAYELRRESELIPAFMEAYPRLCEQAEKRLGKIYNPTDYPDAKFIRSKFRFRYQIVRYGVPGELKELKKELWKREQDKARQVVVEAADQIIQIRRVMFLKLAQHLNEKLKDKDGKAQKFHDTTITKLQEFVDSFDIYNVADDMEGAKLAERARVLISGKDVDAIKTTDTLKANILKEMDTIAKELEELVVDKPTRKFRPKED